MIRMSADRQQRTLATVVRNHPCCSFVVDGSEYLTGTRQNAFVPHSPGELQQVLPLLAFRLFILLFFSPSVALFGAKSQRPTNASIWRRSHYRCNALDDLILLA